MKKVVFSLQVFFLAAGITAIVSCNKEQATTTPVAPLDARYELKNGILHFNDAEAFFSVVDELTALDIQKRSQFGQSFGFKSLLNTYAEALDKASQTPETADNQEYFEVVRNYQDILNIQASGATDLRIYNRSVMPIVNREGVVFVGNKAIKFTDFGQIIVMDGDVTKFTGVTKYTQSNNDVIVLNLASRKLLNRCGGGLSKVSMNAARNRFSDGQVGIITTTIPTSVTEFGTVIFTMKNRAYTVGRAAKKTIFGWDRQYITPNRLTVSHAHSTTDCFKEETFQYTNDWYAIDHSGAECTVANVHDVQRWAHTSTFSRFNSMHEMTRAGVTNAMSCQ